MKSDRGLFIVFEGGDGVGKTTQVAQLVQWLVAAGHRVVQTFEPGDSAAGALIRHIVLDPSTGHLAPRAEALLYAADKAHHLAEVVNPALERGAIVVCDRYVDSMIAYQGAGRTLDVAEVEQVARWATGDLHPDLTVLLDVEPGRAVNELDAKDRVEAAGDPFHNRARHYFLALAERDPDCYLVLDARLSREEIGEAVKARVVGLMSEHGKTLGR